jgi:hypothetical protein
MLAIFYFVRLTVIAKVRNVQFGIMFALLFLFVGH